MSMKPKVVEATVTIDGAPFTTFYFGANLQKPYLHPLRAADGTVMTRRWPIETDVAGESKDHPHHQALWIGQKHVNGVNFWENAKGGAGIGTIAMAKLVKAKGGGKSGVIEVVLDWKSPEGKVILREERKMTFYAGSPNRMFDMDANQSITVVAQSVCVDWLGPPGTLDVQYFTAAQRAAVPLTGMVVDSFLGVSLSRIEESPGENSTAVLTRHLYVPAATRGSIQIPPYAQEVTIYQAPTLGISSVMWTQTYGDPNGLSGSMAIGALPFIVGQRRTQQESTIPNASHLWTDIDPDTDRFYTLSFTIRP